MKTRLIAPTEKELFNIILLKHIKSKWWSYAVIWVLTVILKILQGPNDDFPNFLIIFSIIYPFFITWYFWRYTHSTSNKVFFIPRYYEISDDALISRMTDGSNSEVKLINFVKVYSTKYYSLLFLSKVGFIYLPKDGFDYEADYMDFINNLTEIIKNKKNVA
jgi:hypothetical protein